MLPSVLHNVNVLTIEAWGLLFEEIRYMRAPRIYSNVDEKRAILSGVWSYLST